MAEISEREAQGEIAALYGDIRRSLGVGMVNLIYRHMAARPGVLPWAWGVLRPQFANGAVASEAEALGAGIDAGSIAATPREAWFAAGLNDHSLRTVRGIVDAYNRANLANLVAIGALAAFLEDGGAARPARAPDVDTDTDAGESGTRRAGDDSAALRRRPHRGDGGARQAVAGRAARDPPAPAVGAGGRVSGARVGRCVRRGVATGAPCRRRRAAGNRRTRSCAASCSAQAAFP